MLVEKTAGDRLEASIIRRNRSLRFMFKPQPARWISRITDVGLSLHDLRDADHYGAAEGLSPF